MQQNPLSRRERRMLATLDFFLIAVPLALLVLFLLALSLRNRPDTALTYTLHLYPIREEYAGNVAVGDSLLDAVGKREIGRVVGLSVSPAMTDSYDREAKKMRRVAYPGYASVTLTVEAQGRATSGGYHIGPFLLYRGEKMHVRLPHLTASGFCTDIRVLSQ